MTAKSLRCIVAGVLLLCLFSSGVSGWKYRADAENSGNYIDTSGKFPTNNVLWTFPTPGTVELNPAVVNNVVYFAEDMQGTVYAADAQTGAEIWNYQTGIEVYSSPAVIDGAVYIGDYNGDLTRLDAGTGTLKWIAQTYGSLDTGPVVANGVVFFGNDTGTVFALNADTGVPIWKYDILSGTGSPAVSNNVLYIGNETGIYALNTATGLPTWARIMGAEVSDPVVANGIVYFTSLDRLFAMDATDGHELWNVTVGAGPFTPAVSGGVVYAAGGPTEVYAFDANTGALIWTHTITSGASYGPMVSNGRVYIGDVFNLYALDANNKGAEIWNAPFSSYGNAPPAIANGILYVGNNGGLTAFGEPAAPVEKFITATATPLIGPVGTVFTFMGSNTYGDSPAYYTNIFMTNNTPPEFGNLPYNGTKPDDLSVESITGVSSTFVQAPVTGQVWSYDWDTGHIAGGSLLPGSLYTFFLVNETLNRTYANMRGAYTKVQIGIEGPLHADYLVDYSSGSNPLTVSFTDITTGIPRMVNLSFGDGDWTNSTGSWTHTYTSEGTFFPKIYAWNSVSSDSRTNATISVDVSPGLPVEVATGYNIVLKKVLGGTIARRGAYASMAKVVAKKRVDQWGAEDARSVIAPDSDQYFYYIDDYPEKNYEHQGKYVFVNLADNSVTVHDTFTPPLNVDTIQIAGEPPGGWVEAAATVTAMNSDTSGPVRGPRPLTRGAQADTSSCSEVDCRHCYALLISGGFNRDQNRYSYYNDIRDMYYLLTDKYCYRPENIRVLMSDGTDPAEDIYDGLDYDTTPPTPRYSNSWTDFNVDGKDEVNGPATRDNVINNLTDLKTRLTNRDSLFIFTTNHGGNDTVPHSNVARLWLWNGEYLWDDEFVGAVNQIQAKDITMVMEQCYGGGFIDDFATTQTRVIATAANADEPSVRDDFSYAWYSGVSWDEADQDQEHGGNRDGTTSLWEAFQYANWTDWSAYTGEEHPQYSSVAGTAGETLGLGSCSMQKCVGPDRILPGGQGIPTDPDNDCVFEDLDGNGIFDQADVVLYYDTFRWITDPLNEQSVGPFDANQNGRVDFDDIVTLFWDPGCTNCQTA